MAYLAVVSAIEKLGSLKQFSPSIFLHNSDMQSIIDQVISIIEWTSNWTPFHWELMGLDGNMEEQMQNLLTKFEDLIEAHLASSDQLNDSDSVLVVELLKVTQDIVYLKDVWETEEAVDWYGRRKK